MSGNNARLSNPITCKFSTNQKLKFVPKINNYVLEKNDLDKTQLPPPQIFSKENVFENTTISQKSEPQQMVLDNTTLPGNQNHSKMVQ